MKRIVLLIMFFLTTFSLIKAQTVTNGNFENWTTQTLYDEPNFWTTSNAQLVMMGMSTNCTKETDSYSGAFAAKLETVTNGQDSVNGIMVIGMPGNQGISGGYPFVTHPDTVVVHLKYNILPNDTGHFMIFFKNSGNIIGMAGMNILGTQLTYGTFKMPVSWFQTYNTDTIAALVTSSNLDYPVVPGSYVFVDSIQLIGSVLPFPNGGFENWTTISSEEPDDWKTLNYAKTTVPSATKDNDSYNGGYAIRVETIQTIWGQTLGYITNGIMGNNGPESGMPVSLNPSKLTGYYKYLPNGLDTAVVFVMTSRYDALLDSTIFIEMVAIKLNPVNLYTPFEVNFLYSGWPHVDTVNISFASSNLLDSAAYVGLGSALFIDSLNMNFLPVNINKPSEENEVYIFPNPVTDFLSITLKTITGKSSIAIFDALGEKLFTQENNNSESLLKIDVSQFDAGFYFVELRSDNGYIYKTKFIISR